MSVKKKKKGRLPIKLEKQYIDKNMGGWGGVETSSILMPVVNKDKINTTTLGTCMWTDAHIHIN